MRLCCCQIYRFLLTNAPPQSPPSPNVTRRCVSEVGAEVAATCVALCCCPLAVVHLILLLLVVYPCTFFIKQARKAGARCCKIGYAKRRAKSHLASEPGKPKFDPLHEGVESPPPNNSWKQPVEISVGFVIQVERSRVLAFQRTLGCCGLQVPASLKRRIGLWKERSLVGLGKWRCRSKRVHSRRGVDGAESGGSSMERSPSRGEGNESSAESEEGLGEKGWGFQHPFWKECFEGGSVGFWRGLSLCESTRRCLQASTAGD